MTKGGFFELSVAVPLIGMERGIPPIEGVTAMADAQIFPLLGHTALIDVYELTRSFHELLDIPSAKHTNVADIMLTHPPILMIEEGRGERLLNHDSVKKQLSYHNKTQRNEFSGNLRCFLIDPSVIDDNNIRVLYTFLFGQIQKLYYVKKQGEHLCGRLLCNKLRQMSI